jgi:ribonuclease E
MKKEMLINASQPEECRIAIIEDGRLEELYIERASQDSFAGNIYKGVIVNLEPSIQAVFVDFGVGRNGFLHISDVEPSYYRQGGYDPASAPQDREDLEFDDDNGSGPRRPEGRDHGRGRPGRGRGRNGFRPRIKPPIQELFQRGDEVLVQVIKEGIGTKGPTLSTYISIPGRYVVLMPALGRVGVSRKIEDEAERRRLRDILYELNPPRGLGFIVRTAGAGRSRRELSRDLAYLLRLWKAIVRRVQKTSSPAAVYEESDIIIRTIRDIVTSDVDSIIVDRQEPYEQTREFLKLVMPRQAACLQHYTGKDPLFHKYKLEPEIAQIFRREVELPEGGSIVIDQTEALVAIDVNSGSFRIDDSAEETAYRLNLAAAKEIARQLRLRDLGGVIVNDFIDMRSEKHRRGLERALREAMKRDRARTKILRTSPFGLIEMTRQRVRPALKGSVYKDCPCCGGRAVVKTDESMGLEVIRMLMLAVQHPNAHQIIVRVHQDVASFLSNQKRKELSRLEDEGSVTIRIIGSDNVYPEHLLLECRDASGNTLNVPT